MPVRAAPPDPPAIVAAAAAAAAAGRSGCDAEGLGSRGRIRSGRALTGPLIRLPATSAALPEGAARTTRRRRGPLPRSSAHRARRLRVRDRGLVWPEPHMPLRTLTRRRRLSPAQRARAQHQRLRHVARASDARAQLQRGTCAVAGGGRWRAGRVCGRVCGRGGGRGVCAGLCAGA